MMIPFYSVTTKMTSIINDTSNEKKNFSPKNSKQITMQLMFACGKISFQEQIHRMKF